MQPTYLPEQRKTKKQQIRELVISHPECSAEEIANMVGTTKENVWKEKSKMASEGLIVRRRTRTKITAERKDETMFIASDSGPKGMMQSRSPILKGKSLSDEEQYHLRYLNIPAVDSEGIKTIYKDFDNKKKPVEIIAEHGFPPNVVEVEYHRFLKLKGIDIPALQSFIGNELRRTPLEGVEPLEKKFNQEGHLTTDEMIEAVKAIKKYLSNRTSS
jgi:DNA-binding Lrp family transcriptional regulator